MRSHMGSCPNATPDEQRECGIDPLARCLAGVVNPASVPVGSARVAEGLHRESIAQRMYGEFTLPTDSQVTSVRIAPGLRNQILTTGGSPQSGVEAVMHSHYTNTGNLDPAKSVFEATPPGWYGPQEEAELYGFDSKHNVAYACGGASVDDTEGLTWPEIEGDRIVFEMDLDGGSTQLNVIAKFGPVYGTETIDVQIEKRTNGAWTVAANVNLNVDGLIQPTFNSQFAVTAGFDALAIRCTFNIKHGVQQFGCNDMELKFQPFDATPEPTGITLPAELQYHSFMLDQRTRLYLVANHWRLNAMSIKVNGIGGADDSGFVEAAWNLGGKQKYPLDYGQFASEMTPYYSGQIRKDGMYTFWKPVANDNLWRTGDTLTQNQFFFSVRSNTVGGIILRITVVMDIEFQSTDTWESCRRTAIDGDATIGPDLSNALSRYPTITDNPFHLKLLTKALKQINKLIPEARTTLQQAGATFREGKQQVLMSL